jgi:antitoxin component YwqK of YwqJK toxin-antitoxin module
MNSYNIMCRLLILLLLSIGWNGFAQTNSVVSYDSLACISDDECDSLVCTAYKHGDDLCVNCISKITGKSVSTAHFKNGKKEGDQLYWFHSQLSEIVNYSNGSQYGSVMIFKDGRLEAKGEVGINETNKVYSYNIGGYGMAVVSGVLRLGGPKEGVWITFHENGFVFRETPYTYDKKNGTRKFFLPDGRLMVTEVWNMGKLIERKILIHDDINYDYDKEWMDD